MGEFLMDDHSNESYQMKAVLSCDTVCFSVFYEAILSFRFFLL